MTTEPITGTTNTDDADWRTVLTVVQKCADTWVDEARIIGNVRAGDIKRAVREMFTEINCAPKTNT